MLRQHVPLSPSRCTEPTNQLLEEMAATLLEEISRLQIICADALGKFRIVLAINRSKNSERIVLVSKSSQGLKR